MVTVSRRWIFFTTLYLALALVETTVLRGKRDTETPLYHATNEHPFYNPPDVNGFYRMYDLSPEEIEELKQYIKSLFADKEGDIQSHETLKNILKGFTAKVPADTLNKIRWLEEVEYVEEDGDMQLAFKAPWNLNRVDQQHVAVDSSVMPTLDLCYNTCWWNSDGQCDDGGPDAGYNGCDYGTDCADCGPRPPLIWRESIDEGLERYKKEEDRLPPTDTGKRKDNNPSTSGHRETETGVKQTNK
ncbi:uncharacterized protein [Ptychodera flava]|uniref:uncharacterized protein n=1 Tax=Ptychodera flava TaxID=63121 RepID=UPI003969ECAB